ncbi:2-amino-4-hydroxy-6-hydroxymethyldihydropteridine diphosphokinase [Virgibacillus siamensis]|uniref:2-amino-4-hydroxy-6- hydroxymethyldihydropteridine diphosphokinase n=1 Tax=Virgibacillus siamensis TaxID=480071 RepID=UPI0009843D96|nr:2-amino-4-hydroxy-6-hydroxymethyldihydropteridine diphosphokinase [Virgibacillus siamensis]
MTQAFLALGTNIEPRQEHLRQAIHQLGDQNHIEIVNQSSVYETVPVGYRDQSDFLNMVIEINTVLSPAELLDFCQSIEQSLGRKRKIRFGPRTIDLDILIYNQENRKTERLIIPHPRMHERAFVLVPLNEIAADLPLSSGNRTASDYLAALPDSDIKDVRRWTENDLADE